MSQEALSMLIEGFDPKKLEQEEQQFDKEWKEIIGAYQNKTVIQGDFVAIEDLKTADNKSETCAVVKMGEIRGYIPLKEFGVDNKRQLRARVGEPVAFMVLNYDRENNVFVGTRIKALELMAEKFLSRVEEGDKIVAVVKHVSDNLVRADVGGIEVKIPIEEIRYGWIDDLKSEVQKGDHIYVKILSIDKENKKVEVSKKALQENPFPDCLKRYPKGSEHVGTVSGVREYGVFVNLENGVDSLARHLRYENVQKGDRVVVRILNADAKKEHISTRITKIL